MGELGEEALAEAAVVLVVGEAVEAGLLVRHGGGHQDLRVDQEGGRYMGGRGGGRGFVGSEVAEVGGGASDLVERVVEHVEAVGERSALASGEVGSEG